MEFKLLDVPFFSQEEGYCTPSCFKMCLDYFFANKMITRMITWEEICRILKPKRVGGTTWNPIETRKKFLKILPGLEVIQEPSPKSTSRPNLNFIGNQIDINMPTIVHYNFSKFEFGVSDIIGEGHSVVVIGKTTENLIVNDPLRKARHALYIPNFLEAWDAEFNRITYFKILKPLKLTIKEWEEFVPSR